MNIKLLLFSAVALLSFSGITLAQTGPSYTGTFGNTVTSVAGTMSMSTTITLPDSIRGYINFSGYANQPPACGAGSYKGKIVADSFFLSFSSHDTDSGCGFDNGWPFSVKGRFYKNKDSIAGDYQIANPWSEKGFFTLARPSTTAVASVREEHQPRVYPNPVNRQFVVEFPKYSPGAEAIVTDQLGKTVLTKQLTSKTTTIDLDVAEGIYFLNIITPETRSIQKIIVSH